MTSIILTHNISAQAHLIEADDSGTSDVPVHSEHVHPSLETTIKIEQVQPSPSHAMNSHEKFVDSILERSEKITEKLVKTSFACVKSAYFAGAALVDGVLGYWQSRKVGQDGYETAEDTRDSYYAYSIRNVHIALDNTVSKVAPNAFALVWEAVESAVAIGSVVLPPVVEYVSEKSTSITKNIVLPVSKGVFNAVKSAYAGLNSVVKNYFPDFSRMNEVSHEILEERAF